MIRSTKTTLRPIRRPPTRGCLSPAHGSPALGWGVQRGAMTSPCAPVTGLTLLTIRSHTKDLSWIGLSWRYVCPKARSNGQTG